jgi:hypothetical protein
MPVAAVIAVVAQHEVLAWRDWLRGRAQYLLAFLFVEHGLAHGILAALPDVAEVVVFVHPAVDDFHRVLRDAVEIRLVQQLAVEVQPFARLDFDNVAWQANQPLYEVGFARRLPRVQRPVGRTEHHDIEPLRRAEAITVFAHHHHIADLQGGHHRFGGDVERLRDIRADDEVDQDARVDDRVQQVVDEPCGAVLHRRDCQPYHRADRHRQHNGGNRQARQRLNPCQRSRWGRERLHQRLMSSFRRAALPDRLRR